MSDAGIILIANFKFQLEDAVKVSGDTMCKKKVHCVIHLQQ